MPVLIKRPLSGSPGGNVPLGVTATAQAGAQLIHQVQATATNTFELTTFWVQNSSTANTVTPIFEVTNGSSSVTASITSGTLAASVKVPVLTFNQLSLTGTDTAIHAYATLGNTFFVWGYVDRIATG